MAIGAVQVASRVGESMSGTTVTSVGDGAGASCDGRRRCVVVAGCVACNGGDGGDGRYSQAAEVAGQGEVGLHNGIFHGYTSNKAPHQIGVG